MNELESEILRLKQENQALRRTIKDVNIVAVCEELERLKQENEELKKKNERLKTLYRNEGITDICECCSITSAMEAYDYHSALEEIREYCEEQNLKADYTACEIINKINEVLGNES